MAKTKRKMVNGVAGLSIKEFFYPYTRRALWSSYTPTGPRVKEEIDGGLSENWIRGTKLTMLQVVKEYMAESGIPFDEWNDLPPTPENRYFAYEFTTLWVWSLVATLCTNAEFRKEEKFKDPKWYKQYQPFIASVFKKHPNITLLLFGNLDVMLPGNLFLEYAKMDDADFDADKSLEYADDAKATEFKDWIVDNAARANAHDRMRVDNWFAPGKKKSHRQILAEIDKVRGNYSKFAPRLSLFITRLFNKEDLEDFVSKSGSDNREELFMAYFDKMKEFDGEMKLSFIRKYLSGGNGSNG